MRKKTQRGIIVSAEGTIMLQKEKRKMADKECLPAWQKKREKSVEKKGSSGEDK